MTLFQAFILGLIQGLTEFIPVSSSGHLVLVPHFLGWQFDHDRAFVFDVLVQWGTLVAVFIYYWRNLTTITAAFCKATLSGKPFGTSDARMGWYLILATIPAVVVGLLCKDHIAAAFANPRITGLFLLLTATILVVAELIGKRNRDTNKLNWFDALWIGCSQVIALLPGVSRSGATIAGGMTRNLNRSSAAHFSFLMSVPVMVGAGVLAIKDLLAMPTTEGFLLPLAVGFITALISGYLAIRWLISYLSKHSLFIFAGYCLVLGLVIVFF